MAEGDPAGVAGVPGAVHAQHQGEVPHVLVHEGDVRHPRVLEQGVHVAQQRVTRRGHQRRVVQHPEGVVRGAPSVVRARRKDEGMGAHTITWGTAGVRGQRGPPSPGLGGGT